MGHLEVGHVDIWHVKCNVAKIWHFVSAFSKQWLYKKKIVQFYKKISLTKSFKLLWSEFNKIKKKRITQ